MFVSLCFRFFRLYWSFVPSKDCSISENLKSSIDVTRAALPRPRWVRRSYFWHFCTPWLLKTPLARENHCGSRHLTYEKTTRNSAATCRDFQDFVGGRENLPYKLLVTSNAHAFFYTISAPSTREPKKCPKCALWMPDATFLNFRPYS